MKPMNEEFLVLSCRACFHLIDDKNNSRKLAIFGNVILKKSDISSMFITIMKLPMKNEIGKLESLTVLRINVKDLCYIVEENESSKELFELCKKERL